MYKALIAPIKSDNNRWIICFHQKNSFLYYLLLYDLFYSYLLLNFCFFILFCKLFQQFYLPLFYLDNAVLHPGTVAIDKIRVRSNRIGQDVAVFVKIITFRNSVMISVNPVPAISRPCAIAVIIPPAYGIQVPCGCGKSSRNSRIVTVRSSTPCRRRAGRSLGGITAVY